MSGQISRRDFVAASGVTVASLAAAAQGATPPSRSVSFRLPAFTKARVLRVFIGRTTAWPKPSLDVSAEVDRLKAGLDKAPGVEDIEFVGNQRVSDVTTLRQIVEQNKDVDAIFAVQYCLGTSELVAYLADTGIPTMMFSVPYSGHEWCLVPDLAKAGKKIDVVATSDFADAAQAYRQFRAIHRLKETKVLFVGGSLQAPDKYVADVKTRFGTQIVPFDHRHLVEVYESMDTAAVEAEAAAWIRNASKVVEPSKEEVAKSSRLCLAMQKVLADEKAHAITINCLGLFSQKGLPAYPCFGFVRLNDLGLIGVCEADLLSTMTQTIYQHLTGKTGFVTDPMFDTSNNTLIHAHCVAATKMDGPAGRSEPYAIRSHLEDNKGAVLQTKMRIGQTITMAKLVGTEPAVAQRPALSASPLESYGSNTMLVSTGKIVAVPDSDRGCRSQITVKVADARKMLEQWSHGLHRVIFYGDHVADTQRLGRFLGMNVVMEG